MGRTARAIQTPGEPQQAAQEQQFTEGAGDQSGQAGEGITESASDAAENKAAYSAPADSDEVAALKAQLAATQAERDAAVRAAAVAARRAKGTLPNADEVDHRTLREPKLTQQGWVVPVTFGSPPAIAAAR